MPLPTGDNLEWPPRDMQGDLDDITEAAAWYSGDRGTLAAVYMKRRALAALADGSPQGRRLAFWQRSIDETQPDHRVHAPLPADIASVSADLLFSEQPRIEIPEAHEVPEDDDAPGQPDGEPRTPERVIDGPARESQDELDRIVAESSLHAALLEGAEIASALGGVYLRPDWDTDLLDVPFTTVVHPDQAIPDFSYGRLRAVTFWREVARDGQTVFRHLERREPGLILHGLYAGTTTHLGRQVDLGAMPATKGLDDVITLSTFGDGSMANTLLAHYVPNVKPNRKRRGSHHGRSDYSGGVVDMFDALDETMTSWMRDIRLGKARIIAARDMLSVNTDPRKPGNQQRGAGKFFDDDREVFVPVEMDPQSMERNPITPVEFKIRTQEHSDTALSLIERAVSGAGYSPQSFGLKIEGRAESGTALRLRERKSFATKARKELYWSPSLSSLAEQLQALNRTVFGRSFEVFRPRVQFADSVQEDPTETAQSVELYRRARAASTETLVRMAHADWDDPQVRMEVERIEAEEGRAVPDPMGMGVVA